MQVKTKLTQNWWLLQILPLQFITFRNVVKKKLILQFPIQIQILPKQFVDLGENLKFGFCLKSKVDPSWWELFTSFLSLSRQCTGEAGRGRYYFKYFLNIGNRRYCFKYISNIGSRLSSISKPVLERYVQNGLIGRTPFMFQKLEALLIAEWRHILSETWDIFPRNLRYIFTTKNWHLCNLHIFICSIVEPSWTEEQNAFAFLLLLKILETLWKFIEKYKIRYFA